MSAPHHKCTTCGLAFTTLLEVSQHYQSDFHAANVRLRVDGKVAMSKREFDRSHQDGDDVDETQFLCKLCKKTFGSVHTLQSHLRSTQHLMRKEQRIIERDSKAGSMLSTTSLGSAALGLHKRFKAHFRGTKYADPTAPQTDNVPKAPLDDREKDTTPNSCLFCGLISPNISENLIHMRELHAFNVPLLRRCKDIKGLLEYLCRKVNGCLCLVCGESTKSYTTLGALRDHMKNADHVRIVLGPEYEDFYEGTLDDDTAPPSEVPVVMGENPNAQALVLHDGRVAKARSINSTGGLNRQRRETEVQRDSRRAITSAAADAAMVLAKERAELVSAQQKLETKIQAKACRIQNKYDMKLSIKANRTHPKGYDGEGEMS